MMVLNSSRLILPFLFTSAVAIISQITESWRPVPYTLRMYAFISATSISPLLSASTLVNAPSRPASDLSMSSPKTTWKPAATLFSKSVTRLPVALTLSPTAVPAEQKSLPASAAMILPASLVAFTIESAVCASIVDIDRTWEIPEFRHK